MKSMFKPTIASITLILLLSFTQTAEGFKITQDNNTWIDLNTTDNNTWIDLNTTDNNTWIDLNTTDNNTWIDLNTTDNNDSNNGTDWNIPDYNTENDSNDTNNGTDNNVNDNNKYTPKETSMPNPIIYVINQINEFFKKIFFRK
jgi:hypothetical protein